MEDLGVQTIVWSSLNLSSESRIIIFLLPTHLTVYFPLQISLAVLLFCVPIF